VERSGGFLDLFKALGNIVAEGSESELPALSCQLLSRVAYPSTGGFDPMDAKRGRVRSNALPGPFRRHCGIPHTLWRGADCGQLKTVG